MQHVIDIRVLGPDDDAMLERVADGVFDNAVLPEQAARFLADPRHVLVVALVDDTVIGITSAVEYFHPDKQPALWINEVGVATPFRRQGAGRRMIEAVLDVARSRDCTVAWVGTELDNEPARALYESAGAGIDCDQFVAYEWDTVTRPPDA